MADNQLTRAQVEEILEEYIPKFLSAFNTSDTGKNISKNTDFLESIKTLLTQVVTNTGPDGSLSSRNIVSAVSQINNNRPNSSGSTTGGSNQNTNLILEDLGNVAKDSGSKLSKSMAGVKNSLKALKMGLSAIGAPLEKVLNQLEANNQMYGTLVQSGTLFGSSASQMAKEVNDAGFTVQTFTKLLSQGSAGIQALGGRDFLKLASSIEKTNSQLGDFGLGADNSFRAFSDYADYMRITGNIDKLRNEDLGKSFHDLMGRTVALTSAFGVSIQEFMKTRNELATNQVSQAMIAGAASRYGISEDDINSRISMMKTMGYSQDAITSILRRANGVNDAYSAANQGVVGLSQGVLSARTDEEAFNQIRRVNDYGYMRARSDTGMLNPAAASFVQNNPYMANRFSADTDFRRMNARGSQINNFAEYQRQLNSNDSAATHYQGLSYSRERGQAALQSLDTHMISSFTNTIGSSIGVIQQMYNVEYPKLAKAINGVTDALGRSYDNTISSQINQHSDGLARALSPFMFGQQAMTGTILGGAAGGLGTYAFGRLMRNRLGKALSSGGSAGTILEEGENAAAGASRTTGILRNIGRYGRYAKGLGILGVAAGAASLYGDLHSINSEHSAGHLSDADAAREKWEAWGQNIGATAGGIGGASIGAGAGMGMLSVPLAIALGAAGSWGLGKVGRGIGDVGYAASTWFGHSEGATGQSSQPGNQTSNTEQIDMNPQIHDQREEIAGDVHNISLQLAQLISLNRNVLRVLGNISPYTHN